MTTILKVFLTIIVCMIISYCTVTLLLADFIVQDKDLAIFLLFSILMGLYAYWWFYIKPQPKAKFNIEELRQNLAPNKLLPYIDLEVIKFTPQYVQFFDKNLTKIAWQDITDIYFSTPTIYTPLLVFVYKSADNKKEQKYNFRLMKIPFNIQRTGKMENLAISYWQLANGKQINVIQ